MGYRVGFLELFFCCLSASDAQELNNAMAMSTPEIIDSIPFNKPQCSGLCEADENPLIAWDSETDAIFCTAMDLTTRQRSFKSNPRNAALFGMCCDEFISKASNFDLAIPLCEVDALILLLYRSVHRIRGQEPAVIFLRMYIGASRTGSLIRESLRVENDELQRTKEVRSAALDSGRQRPLAIAILECIYTCTTSLLFSDPFTPFPSHAPDPHRPPRH